MATDEEKREHGKRLVEAMAAKPLEAVTLADMLGIDRKTVTNWRSGKTMPSAEDRVRLRGIFGSYDSPGDPVERAVKSSELDEWRQDDVLSRYKRHLQEQRREVAG